MKKLLYFIVITIFTINLQTYSVFANTEPVQNNVSRETLEKLKSMQNRAVLTPQEIQTLSEILPKEIVSIAGTTAVSTGAVISTPILIGVCILMITVGASLTVYNFWKYYNSMTPTEGENGVVFRPTYSHGTNGSYEYDIQGSKFWREFKYIDVSSLAVGDMVSLGIFNYPLDSTTTYFARYKKYNSSTNTWSKHLQDQSATRYKYNIWIVTEPYYIRGYGSVLPYSEYQAYNATTVSTVKPVPINSYLSVWTPQEELFLGGRIIHSSSKGTTELRYGADHWSSIYNALKGGFSIRNSLKTTTNTLGKFSIYIEKVNKNDTYVGAEIFSQNLIEDETSIKIPEHIKEDEDFIIKTPTIEEWANSTPTEPKPELITPTAPDTNYNPYPGVGEEVKPEVKPIEPGTGEENNPDLKPQPDENPDDNPSENPDDNPSENPDDNPSENPDDNPSDNPDTPTEPEWDTELNFDPLMFSLGEKFPFCIPFDLKKQMDNFKANAKDPIFVVDMSHFSSNQKLAKGNTTITLDLTIFEKLFLILRYFILASFIVFLIIKTRDLIRG